MNKLFDFKDYGSRSENRPYYVGTWEKKAMETFRMLPFQYKKASTSSIFSMYQDSTDITDHFIDDNLITGWTLTGTGPLSSTGENINSFTLNVSDYIYSNSITLTADQNYYFKIYGNFSGGATYDIQLYNNVTTATETLKSNVTGNAEVTFTAGSSVGHQIRIFAKSTGQITNTGTGLHLSVLEVYESGSDQYYIYDGSLLYDFLTDGESRFNLKCKDYDNVSDYSVTEDLYSDLCDVCRVNTFLTGWTLIPPIVGSGVYHSGKDITIFYADNTVKSNEFYIKKDDVVNIVCKTNTGSASELTTVRLTDGSNIDTFTKSDYGEIIVMTATATFTGAAYVTIYSTNNNIFSTDWELYLPYSDNYTKYTIASSVDYGGLHYADGWEQWIWKKANVRRSPRSEVTVVGDERNGQIIVEKRTSAVRYAVRMKCTEDEFEALIHSMSGNVTITDQTGREFTATNKDIVDPSWYHSNGIIEISFIDENNINVYTLNNSAL